MTRAWQRIGGKGVRVYNLTGIDTDKLWEVYNNTPGNAENEELLIAIEDELERRDKRLFFTTERERAYMRANNGRVR
jgi:hypothetical protein